MKYLLISAGCAECRFDTTDPLIKVQGPFDTVEEAKAATGFTHPQTWIEHPDGGWFSGDGQGDDYVYPISA